MPRAPCSPRRARPPPPPRPRTTAAPTTTAAPDDDGGAHDDRRDDHDQQHDDDDVDDHDHHHDPADGHDHHGDRQRQDLERRGQPGAGGQGRPHHLPVQRGGCDAAARHPQSSGAVIATKSGGSDLTLTATLPTNGTYTYRVTGPRYVSVSYTITYLR